MPGHRSIKTTQHYAKILDRKVSDDRKSGDTDQDIAACTTRKWQKISRELTLATPMVS
jgi:hypothetical protein